jgi:hypothetical protein
MHCPQAVTAGGGPDLLPGTLEAGEAVGRTVFVAAREVLGFDVLAA